ncbi:hypothetical protein [Chitinimonas naiadis]
MATLAYHRLALQRAGYDTIQIELLIEQVTKATSPEELRSQFVALEPEANKLEWLFDRDFTALLIQHALPRFRSDALRLIALDVAIDRASWCASAATAGGEGLARSVHVRELEGLRTEFSA